MGMESPKFDEGFEEKENIADDQGSGGVPVSREDANVPEKREEAESSESGEGREQIEKEAADLASLTEDIAEATGDKNVARGIKETTEAAVKAVENNPKAMPFWRKAVLVGSMAMSLLAAAPKTDAEAGMRHAGRPRAERVDRDTKRDNWRFQEERARHQERMQDSRRRIQERGWRTEERGMRHEENIWRHENRGREQEMREVYYNVQRIRVFGAILGQILESVTSADRPYR